MTRSSSSFSSNSSLQVKISNRSLIKASTDVSLKPYVFSFSNFDLISGNHPSTRLYLYPKPTNGGDFSSIVSTIKSYLPRFLDHFLPFAGRIATNSTTGLPEVVCNNAGALLLEAQANLPLEVIDFHDMKSSQDMIVLPYAGDVALCVQVVGYSCGGFSVAWSSNHMLTDATSHSEISHAWTELLRTGEITGVPPNQVDRSVVFKPRSPPSFSPELDRSYMTFTSDDFINVLSGSGVSSGRMYYVASSDLDRLRDLASRSGRKSTRIEAFSAHVWKVLASVVGESDPDCQMGWFVDGRRAMGATKGYVGNILSCVTAKANTQALVSDPLSEVAELVASSIGKVANNRNHFLDLMDWVECHKTVSVIHRGNLGLGAPTIVVSSCHNLPVESEFGFGKAAAAVFHSTGSERLGTGFMQISPCAKENRSWIVSAKLWPEVAAALEADGLCALKPVTTGYLGLAGPCSNLGSVSRL